MKRTTTIIGVTALAVALLAPLAFAQDPQGRGNGRRGTGDGPGGPQGLIEEMDLSEEQVAALQALREEHLASVELIHAEMQAAHEALRALAENEQATFADVELAEERLIEARRAMNTERRFQRAQAYELLTPEQQALVPNAWRLGLDRGHGRRGNGRMNRGGGSGPDGAATMGRGGRHGRRGHHGMGSGRGQGRRGNGECQWAEQ